MYTGCYYNKKHNSIININDITNLRTYTYVRLIHIKIAMYIIHY